MFAIIHLLATFIADLFKSPRRLEVENLFLRHQTLPAEDGEFRYRIKSQIELHERVVKESELSKA